MAGVRENEGALVEGSRRRELIRPRLGDVHGDLVTEDLRHLAEPTINFASQILSGQHAKVLKRGRPQ